MSRGQTPYDDYGEPTSQPSRHAEDFDLGPEIKQPSALGITSLIIGVMSLMVSFVPCIGVIAVVPAIIGLLIGGVGLVVARSSNQGTGMPITGSIINVLAIVVVGLWFLLFAAIGEKAEQAKKDLKARGPVRVTALEIDDDYNEQVDAVTEKYEGRPVIVTGKVASINRDLRAPKIIVKLIGLPGSTIDCDFDAEHAEDLRNVAVGTTVTIRGECEGKVDGHVRLDDCVLEHRPEDPGPAMVTGANTLVAEYEANEIAADNKYQGKTLELTSTVSRVVRNKPGKATVELALNDGGVIECDFATPDEHPPLAKLIPGDRVTIQGRCLGMINGTVTLETCKLVTNPSKKGKAAAGKK